MTTADNFDPSTSFDPTEGGDIERFGMLLEQLHDQTAKGKKCGDFAIALLKKDDEEVFYCSNCNVVVHKQGGE